MDIAHIILYIAGVVLVFILIIAIRQYYAKLRRRHWLEEYSVGPTGKTNLPLSKPKKRNILPSYYTDFNQKHPNYDADVKKTEKRWKENETILRSQLRKNEKICGQCGSTWYIDDKFSDYNFCKNSSCSSNVDREK